MRYIILLFSLFINLSAECSIKDIEKSDTLLAKAQTQTNAEKKAELLQSSIDICYAPEIKAFLLLLKSKTATNQEKIAYYKELIGVAGEFERDIIQAIELQNESYIKLSQLYKPINPQLSQEYRQKVQKIDKSTSIKSNNLFKYGFISFVLALFGFIVWISFKK